MPAQGRARFQRSPGPPAAAHQKSSPWRRPARSPPRTARRAAILHQATRRFDRPQCRQSAPQQQQPQQTGRRPHPGPVARWIGRDHTDRAQSGDRDQRRRSAWRQRQHRRQHEQAQTETGLAGCAPALPVGDAREGQGGIRCGAGGGQDRPQARWNAFFSHRVSRKSRLQPEKTPASPIFSGIEPSPRKSHAL